MTQTRPGWVEYRGRTLYDTHGSKIGRIVEIYLDQEGGHAEWALVHTGLLGTK
jgi:sporulation protein YlmC with PRC-barrel domain